MLTVVCVKTRPRYDHSYVNRLHCMVSKHLTVPHRFVCLTDDDDGVECETLPIPRGLMGWWGKIALFRPDVLTGQVLFLDLDTLIINNIDFLSEFSNEFAILRDFYRPEGYGSGMMIWNKPHEYIWKDWVMAGCPNHPLGDQGWMEHMLPDAERLQDLFPGKIVSYKEHCEPCPPDGAAIVCFHGDPKPHDFGEDHWVSKAWL